MLLEWSVLSDDLTFCSIDDLHEMTFGELDRLSNQVAFALTNALSLKTGDAVAIAMPMTVEVSISVT